MHKNTFSDLHVLRHKSDNYILTVHLGVNGFSFNIYDSQQKSHIYLKHVTLPSTGEMPWINHVKAFVLGEELLLQTYKKIVIFIDSPDYTLVPETLFDSTKAREILSFNRHIEDHVKIFHSSIPAQKLQLIYSLDTNLCDFLSQHFKNSSLLHPIESLLHIMQGLGKELNPWLINFHPEGFDCLIFDSGQLHTANYFDASTAEDISFFLHQMIELHQKDPHHMDLYLTGYFQWEDPWVQHISNYIKEIKPLPWDNIYPRSTAYEQLASFQHALLLAGISCVS